MYGQLDCLGVKLDTGEAFPISYWPPGYTVERTPGVTRNGVLLDASGNTVLREGDRVSVRLSAVQAGGDTRCSSTTVATVLDFHALAAPADPPPSSG